MRETVNKPVDGMGKVGKLEVSGSGELEGSQLLENFE